MASTFSHESMVRLAMEQAQQATRLSDPNPRVGCVITSPSGEVFGLGHTQRVGEAHAEVMALRDAAAKGRDVRGATAFVTLEPCAHHGRTPPCCDALIEAGIARAVVVQQDPNALVAGKGLARMRAAGIDVEVLPPEHPSAVAVRELNIGFFSRMVRQTPWVRMKIAASLDGVTALPNGQSQWITSPEARADGHSWRARASAVLTGIGTLLEDNPQLDVRLVETARQPSRVIVDSQLQTPTTARIFDAGGPVWIYTAMDDPTRSAALRARGATVTCLPDPNGKVDLRAMMKDLARREVNELHIEAGSKLNGSLIRAKLVDEFLIYLAPTLLGTGAGMAAWGPLQALTEGLALEFRSTEAVGQDLRILARVAGKDPF
ncbi:bifunctional diaminohydroxyphosphoribosylaminopyrimidine deaminase/5-amino-6-(5-phosphoribosylamino)uracil reductase RibD [Polaromonas sp. YR568]|uniref:bifunctional diaminohydroxyphosphoribosylaminopyrimidine deaminase/5-amino-6-(5-phosphoribosylamino)uracil reductase RibD n=1 Tax=Polaromonas sp. YR568 TaxID=1855301 RepID=UPI0031378887